MCTSSYFYGLTPSDSRCYDMLKTFNVPLIFNSKLIDVSVEMDKLFDLLVLFL